MIKDKTVYTRILFALIGMGIGALTKGIAEFPSSQLGEWFKDSYGAKAQSMLLVGLLSFVMVLGWSYLMAWTGRYSLRLLVLTASVATLITSVVVWNVGLGLDGNGDDEMGHRVIALALALIMAGYILLVYVQSYQKHRKFFYDYRTLFYHGWNNIHWLLLAGVFTLVYWLLILLWVSLFKILNITIFEKIFFSKLFILLTVPAALGLGIALVREKESIILALRGVTFLLLQLLMPIVTAIVLLFVVALPFTGLQPLWDTRLTSWILVALMMLMIIFINISYQEGEHTPSRFWRWQTYLLIAALPLLAGLSLYSIWLRVEQYGLIPKRVYSLVIVVVLGCYGLGYLYALCAKRGWLPRLPQVNVVMSIIVISLALLLHTPPLDALKLSAYHQYQRLARGQVDAEKFDYATLVYKLGPFGRAMVDRLLQEQKHPQHAAIAKKIEQTRSAGSYWAATQVESKSAEKIQAQHVIWINGKGKIPEAWMEAMTEVFEKDVLQHTDCQDEKCLLYSINLDNDAEDEQLFFINEYVNKEDRFWRAYIIDKDSQGHWLALYADSFRLDAHQAEGGQAVSLKQLLLTGTIKAKPPNYYHDVYINDDQVMDGKQKK